MPWIYLIPVSLLFTLFSDLGGFQFSERPVQAGAHAEKQLAFDASRLSQDSFQWSPAELLQGFAHWDQVYPGARVLRAKQSQALPKGQILAAFSNGGRFREPYLQFRREQKLAGVLVLHQGQVRWEDYALGHSQQGRWVSQSIAKSITSTLLGIALKEGKITSLNDPVSKYLPALHDSAYRDVSVEQLLTMTSGVAWNEDYSDPQSDIARFYAAPLKTNQSATVSYMGTLPRAYPPGQRWVYNTGETHLLGELVAAATGQPLEQYLSEKLWQPLGMEQEAYWSYDRSGKALGGCCLHLNTRDLARFGQFVLQQGQLGGRQLLPQNWFAAATSIQAQWGEKGRGYGYQWWAYEAGFVQAIGIHGQLLHIDPRHDLVVVINSAWPEAVQPQRSWEQLQFIDTVIAELGNLEPE